MSDFENKVYHSRSFVVFFEKSRVRMGLIYKCTVYLKPIRGDAWQRMQAQTVYAKDFVSFRMLLKGMMKNKNKRLKDAIEARKKHYS